MPYAAATTSSPSGLAHRSSIAARGAVDVECELAAEEVVGAEAAEHEVRVGDGRLGAAAAVAGRPGLGARAQRADAQRPPESTQAIEPPPAPISARSMTGVRIG